MRLKPHEKQFLERFGRNVRARDLATILGRTAESAKKLKARYARGPRGARMSAHAAQLNLSRLKRREAEYVDIRLRHVQVETRDKHWEAWQIAELRSGCGVESVATIARRIGKTRLATQKKAQRLGLDCYQYSVIYLAKRLRLTRAQIKAWTADFSGDKTGHKVRWYRDGRQVFIHREDARWLLDNPDLARARNFPDHPGKLDVGIDYDDASYTQDDNQQRPDGLKVI